MNSFLFLITFATTFFISWRSMRQTSQPSGAEKKEAMKQAFKANSSRSSRGGQDTQSAKAEKAEKADVSSKKPTGTSTSSLRYRPFNFFLMCRCTILHFKRLSEVFHYFRNCKTKFRPSSDLSSNGIILFNALYYCGQTRSVFLGWTRFWTHHLGWVRSGWPSG